MSARTLLIIVIILLLIGALPAWPYSAGWGFRAPAEDASGSDAMLVVGRYAIREDLLEALLRGLLRG